MQPGERPVQKSFQDRLLARGGCSRGVWRPSQRPICCDVADQNHESQCGATETDGHRYMKTPAPSKRVCLGSDGTIWLKYAASAVSRTLKRTFASLVPTAGQRDVPGDEGKCIA